MNWFKETWWLVKQLFTTTKNKHMDHYPFSGYSAMSWCGYILTKKKESNIKTTTWNHENIHLQQAKNKGSWLKYYTDYVWEWIKGNPITYPASSAYYTIPYEMEAYANEDKSDYYSKGTEQKSYMNTLREYMFKNGMINNIGDKVTSKQIKKAIKSLPKDMKSIEAAYLQFATPGQYTKWFNKIPLLGTYPIVNKQFQNYEEDKDKARE